MSFLSPEFKLTILPFNAPKGKEYDMPQEMVGRISSARSLMGNSISLNIPNGMKNLVGLKRFKEVFHDQCVVRLYVRKNPSDIFRQLNVGYCNGISVNLNPSGKVDWSITFPGLEAKLQKQELFLDVATEKQEAEAKARSKTASTFEAAFTSIGQSLANVKSQKNLLIGIWNNIIVKLVAKYDPSVSTFQYGGFEFARDWAGNQQDPSALISPFFTEGYTENFVSKFNLFSQVEIGASPRFWEAISSMATQPLYECFIDAMDTLDIKDLTVLDALTSYGVGDSSPTSLIFRKTPFDTLFNQQGEWNFEKDFKKLQDIKSLSFSENPDDIYSGLHIGLSEFDSQDSTLIFPVKWSSALKKRYGYRVMQIKLDGLSFGMEETRTLADKNNMIVAMKQIQDRLFSIFLPIAQSSIGTRTYLKNVQASATTSFDFYRPGNAYDLGDHEANEFYGKYGYLTSVTDSFSPQGEASSSLNLKWVDNKEELLPKF